MKPFLVRGALAGLAGGLALVLALLLLGEPSIRDAIAIEEASADPAVAAEEPLFTRPEQVVGGALGAAAYGVLAGLVFGVVYAAGGHRLRARGPFGASVRLGGLAFGAAFLVPYLKYPPNPPAVGDPDTVVQRTVAYLVMIAISVVVTVVAVRLHGAWRSRGWPEHLAGPAAVALFVVVVGLAFALMPGNPDPIEVPATLIWRFRLASLGGQVTFWAVVGVVHGWLALRDAGVAVFSVDRSATMSEASNVTA